MDFNLSRRRFLETSAAALGVSLLGCHGDAGAPQTRANADGSFTVAGVGAVAAGKATTFIFPNGEPGLLFVTPAGVVGAVSARCTHQGCVVQWEENAKSPLRCPCHESHFALDGRVLSGPARAPLTRYAVTKNGDEAILRAL